MGCCQSSVAPKVNLDVGAHDPARLVRSVALARLAYAEPAEVEYLLKRGPEPFKAGPDEGPLYRAVEAAVADLAGYTFYTGKEHPDPAARRDAQAYLLLYPSRRTIVLAFRGTQSLADALDDADLRLKPLQEEVQATSALAPLAEEPEVVVHSGFREQFLSIEAALSRDLQPHVDSGEYDTLVCCGHSLGGALSTLAAPWYACRHPRLRVVADTFGSPLVGDARFAGWYGSTVPETARCWNQYDPVSRVPVGFGYTHVEHSVRFAGSATGQLGATAVGAGRVFSGGWRLLAVAAGMAQELGAEHHLTSYYSSLTSALASNQQTAVMQ